MNEIRQCVDAVRRRQQRQWMWQSISVGLVVSGVLGCAIGVMRLMAWGDASWTAIAAVLLIGPAVGWLVGMIRRQPERGAAVAIDRTYGLKDRITTALGLLTKASLSDVWRELQHEDARRHAASVEPTRVVPMPTPKSWTWGVGLSLLAIGLVVISSHDEQLAAAVVSNDVVIAQADAVAQQLEELAEFNAEATDPEVEALLKDLAEKLDELKQPGVDPREALATLSEMEAALQKQQEQLADPNIDAQLAAIGEALTLSDQMQSAGEAMSQGELEKAADELARLEMPKLDRQTEKAITEKLEKVQQNEGDGAARKLKEAAGQTAAGLSQGNRNRFKEGMEGLAGECRKQGRRKKLSDLLKKQCRCLCECKGECEKECKNDSNSNKKGGKNWGLARSDNQPGDKTPNLKSANKMNITGQESAGGDVDVETMTAPETEQAAVRKYREQADKYEQLTESVLDSEPIPLGHRQTIRRYFEMIRPKAGEVDAVIKSSPDVE